MGAAGLVDFITGLDSKANSSHKDRREVATSATPSRSAVAGLLVVSRSDTEPCGVPPWAGRQKLPGTPRNPSPCTVSEISSGYPIRTRHHGPRI